MNDRGSGELFTAIIALMIGGMAILFGISMMQAVIDSAMPASTAWNGSPSTPIPTPVPTLPPAADPVSQQNSEPGYQPSDPGMLLLIGSFGIACAFLFMVISHVRATSRVADAPQSRTPAPSNVAPVDTNNAEDMPHKRKSRWQAIDICDGSEKRTIFAHYAFWRGK